MLKNLLITLISAMLFLLLHGFVSAQSSAEQQSSGKKSQESQILMPEVFELANIAFALTDFSQSNENMTEKTGDYYERVTGHFAPHKDHDLIKKLDALVKKNYMAYVANRGYAVNFVFEGDKLKPANIYPPERKFQLIVVGDAFNDLSLWEDFAKKSDFRRFYAENKQFYSQTLARAAKNLPIGKIWAWLEREFPARFDRYWIYVSPLIGGTHSTFSSSFNNLNQCFMFVSDASRYDTKRFTAKQIEGLYTGIVFTEIDHNYNNPISARYEQQIQEAMPDLSKWSSGAEAGGGNYRSALKIFDEYATHSLYLLYIRDNFAPADYEVIKQNRIALMTKRRGFTKFEEFHNEFLRLYETKKQSEKISDIYPLLILWLSTQNK
mgnify:CR=1 FL=1